MEKSPPELIALFASVAPGGPEAEERKMFGYPCAFVHGNMFMGLHERSFMVRLDEERRAEAMAAGGQPFAPMGRAMKEYVTLPESILRDAERLRAWVERSYAYAAALPVKEPRPRRATKR